MVVHHKQIQRKRNRERETGRYKRKREKRAYLTEAYLNHIPWQIAGETMILSEEVLKKDWLTPEEDKAWEYLDEKPVKFNWFEKFLLWIKKW